MGSKGEPGGLLTFSGHLAVLRRLLMRVTLVVIGVAVIVFVFKETTFNILLGPSEWDFVTYSWIEDFMHLFNHGFHFDKFYVDMIATELSSQFMTHLTTAFYLGLLCASPFVVYELYRFVAPALYENERRYSRKLVMIMYALFMLGVLMSYFILFPISFRFLGTYSVDPRIHTTVTLDSYISTFTTLTLMMGLVFQLPVIAYVLAKMGIVEADTLVRYRKYAFLIIMVVAAIITPPDVMTLILVGIPLYLLYEVSIKIIRRVRRKSPPSHPT